MQACATTLKGRLVTFSQSVGIIPWLICFVPIGKIVGGFPPPKNAFGGKADIEIYALVAWFVVLVVL